jgi:hypothetical protein
MSGDNDESIYILKKLIDDAISNALSKNLNIVINNNCNEGQKVIIYNFQKGSKSNQLLKPKRSIVKK